jgi:hypothetical protein
LYKNSEFLEYIILVTVNDGDYNWVVGDYKEGGNYRIGIWDFNDFNSSHFSDNFRILLELPLSTDVLTIVIIGLLIGVFGLIFLLPKKLKKTFFSNRN